MVEPTPSMSLNWFKMVFRQPWLLLWSLLIQLLLRIDSKWYSGNLGWRLGHSADGCQNIENYRKLNKYKVSDWFLMKKQWKPYKYKVLIAFYTKTLKNLIITRFSRFSHEKHLKNLVFTRFFQCFSWKTSKNLVITRFSKFFHEKH